MTERAIEITREKVNALRGHLSRRQREILALTRSLVEAESPAGDELDSNKVASLLAASARSIGAITSIDRIASESYGCHLRLRAFNSTGQKTPPLVILGHTDTVHLRGSLTSRPWRVEGSRIYGPCMCDMKANCALALEALRACEATGLKPQRPLTVLRTCDEENGSPAGRGLVESEARRAHAALVLEPPASGGQVKTARKGTGMFTIAVTGRAAHAGLDPEKGVSAVLELAKQTIRLHELNDPALGTTVTVNVVGGGSHSNVIPAEARAEVDMRFTSADAGAKTERSLLSWALFD